MKEDYFDKVGVSNSYLTYFEQLLLNNNRGHKKKFREHSWAAFVGTQVHLAMETDGDSLSKLIVSDEFSAKLKGKENIVWEDVISTVNTPIEEAVKKVYTNDVEKRITYFQCLFKEYQEEQQRNAKKVNISTEKLKWGLLDNEKVSDEYTLKVIEKAYKALSDKIHNIKHSWGHSATYKELEIYWTDKLTKLKCKAKPDYLLALPNGMWLFDFKIGVGDIHTKIRDRRYLRQLSWYSEAVFQEFGVRCTRFTLLYFNINTEYLEIVEIALNDIEKAKVGGYYTPEFFNQANGMFCTQRQLDFLAYSEIWTTPNEKYKVQGWRELLTELYHHSTEGMQFFESIFDAPKMIELNITENNLDLPF